MYIVKIIGIGSLVLGVIFVIISVIYKTSFAKKKKLCTSKVMATVVEIQEHVNNSMNDVSIKVHTCFNCYQYEINGKVYKQWSNTGCMPGKFVVGDIVELNYNDDNHKQFYVEKENNKFIHNVFVFTSIILLLLGFALLYMGYNF